MPGGRQTLATLQCRTVSSLCRRRRLVQTAVHAHRSNNTSTSQRSQHRNLSLLSSSVPPEVKIVEVGPRDGLQNEKTLLTVEQRLQLVQQLIKAGCRHVEVGSFVSPKAIPAMAHTGNVMDGVNEWLAKEDGDEEPTLARDDDGASLILSTLVPNLRGLYLALQHQVANKGVVNEIAIFASASEGFSQRNLNCSVEESFDRYQQVVDAIREHNDIATTDTCSRVRIRGYISNIISCPYDGPMAPSMVARLVERMAGDLQCDEISLGDTIGVGTPASVLQLLQTVQSDDLSAPPLAVHFHDTYGQSLANILVALESGIRIVDSSVAGLGGCPFAGPGASGNVATEDVLYMLHGLGVETGIDLDKLVDVGEAICQQLEMPTVRSKVGKAILAKHATSE